MDGEFLTPKCWVFIDYLDMFPAQGAGMVDQGTLTALDLKVVPHLIRRESHHYFFGHDNIAILRLVRSSGSRRARRDG